MTPHSLYALDCVCGKQLESRDRELVCPACGRQIQIEWPAKAADECPTREAGEAKRAAA